MARFKNDGPITVTVNVPKQASTSGDAEQRKRKLKFRETKKDIFKRTKKEGLMTTFYDLGYIKDGAVFETIPFTNILPTIIQDPTTPYVSIRDLGVPDYENLRDDVLAIGASNFEEKSMLVKKGVNSANYAIKIQIGTDIEETLDNLPSDKWTDQGLKVTKTEIATLRIGNGYVPNVLIELSSPYNRSESIGIPAFVADINSVPEKDFSLRLKESPFQKITSIGTYVSPAVSMDITGPTKVFLMPAIVLSHGISTATPVPSPPNPIHFSRLNLLYTLLPRERLNKPSDPYYMLISDDVLYPFQYDIQVYNHVLAVVHSHEALPGSRGIDRDFNGGNLGSSFFYMPTPLGVQDSLSVYFGWAQPIDSGPPNGVLKAVVEHDGNFYYIWTHGFS